MKTALVIGWSICIGLATPRAARAQPEAAPSTGPASALPSSAAPSPPAPSPPAPSEDNPTGLAVPSTVATASANPWEQGATPAQRARAKQLVAEGNQHLSDGLMERAAASYRAASQQWDHPAIWYNLALALVSLDQPVEMYEALIKAQRWRDHSPAPLQEAEYAKIKDFLPLVEKQIATVEISCEKEGALVSLDGKRLFVVEKGKPNKYVGKVRVGKHTFVAEKPGFATPVDAPFIGPGETFRVELRLFTADELTRYRRRWSRTWMPYAVIGGGLLAGLVGGGLQLAARSDFDAYDTAVARCLDAERCGGQEARLAAIRDRGETKRTLGIVGYGVAGAAVVAGAALLYLNRRQAYLITTDEYRMELLREEQEAARQPKVSFAPLVTSAGAGAMLLGEF